MLKWKPKFALTGAAMMMSLALSPVMAGQVTLASPDGSVSMDGDLLEFDGTTYRLKLLIGEISILASQVICTGPGCPNAISSLTEFTIAGVGQIGSDILPTLIEVFALERGGDISVSQNGDGNSTYNVLEADGTVYATINVGSGQAGSGLAALLDGSASIGAAAQRADQNQIAAFSQSGLGSITSVSQEHVLALDGVVVAVNRNNPVQLLSLAQVRQVFDGSITNWQQLGGNDAPISLYRMDDASPTNAVFAERALGNRNHVFSSNANLLASDAAVSDAVSADINGIGLTTYSAQRNASAATLRSVCGQLFEPSEFSIKTEEYPLSQRLYLYTGDGSIPDVATEFLEFATSAPMQSVVRNLGYVSQDVGLATLDEQGRRMAQAIVSGASRTELLQLQDLTANLLDATRLSFTFRFDAAGNLEPRSAADVGRLAAMISDGKFSSQQLLIFGFSNNLGGVNELLNSTQDNAQLVRDAIVNATGRANLGNVRLSPIGYGRLLPLNCNETNYGVASNNRVEIWVK